MTRMRGAVLAGVGIGLLVGGYRVGAQSYPGFQMYGVYNGLPKALALASDGTISVSTSGADGAIQDGASSAIEATVRDYANSNPLAVAITDASGDLISSFGGGTQYTEGDTDASITGTALLFEGAADTLVAAPGTAANGLDVDVTRLSALVAGDADIGNVDLELAGTAVGQTNPVAVRLSDGTNFLTPSTDQTVGSAFGTTGPGPLARYLDFDGSALPTATNVDTESEAVPVAASIKGVQYVMYVNEDGSLQYFTSTTPGIVSPAAATTGGADIFRSIDLDETEEEVKATAGTLYGIWASNLATSTRFLKCYNATAANVTVGTTTPVITFPLPGNASDDVSGHLVPGSVGYAFGTALTCAATTGIADNDTGAPGANEVVINAFYK